MSKQEKYNSILDALQKLLENKTIQSISVSEIAQAAGMGKGSIYYYFPSKDAILEALIEKGKGLELNTGGLRSGLRDVNPCADVLKRYRELGGEILTVGSDSHSDSHISFEFEKACELLKECGFRYYTVFEKRSPEFRRL